MKSLKIFGDSILRGVIYSSEQQKYKLCDDCKFKSLASYDVDAHNYAKMGLTIDGGLNALHSKLDNCDENTTVLLEFGGNDCDYKWADVSADPEGSFVPNTPADAFVEKYSNAIEFARSRGATVAVANLVPIDPVKYMKWISRGLNYDNIMHWLGDVTMLSRWQEYYSRLTEQIAAMTGCRLLDLRNAFLLDHGFSDLLCADGVHPTQRGHNIIKERITAFMQGAN